MLWIYSKTGRFADAHAANGTWTYNHLLKLWWSQDAADKCKQPQQPYIQLIYPPVNTEDFTKEADKVEEGTR